jgi:hypothetical protein
MELLPLRRRLSSPSTWIMIRLPPGALTPPLPSNYYSFLEDYQLGVLSSGTHTVTIEADSTGLTLENNEGDNSYTKTFEVE